MDYRRSADVYLERDLLNAMAFNTERVVVGGMGRSRSPQVSLVHTMNGIEDSHKAALQQGSATDSMSSLMSSLNGMTMSNQDNGYSLPLNLDEFGQGSRE